MSESSGPTLSVVLPVYEESDNIEPLWRRLEPVLRDCVGDDWEVIFVDDGSRDGSTEKLRGLNDREPRVKVLCFSRNFGHQAALQAGLDASRGEAVVLMDADLQDPPEVIPRFLERWRDGHEIVYAVRTQRKEGALMRAAYALFYRTMRAMAEIDIPVDSGDFCLLDRRVVEVLVGLPERNRFLRGLRTWVGFRQTGVEYERDRRHSGRPKYTLHGLFRLAISGYVGFSSMPLRVAGWIGLLTATFGFGTAGWAVMTKFLGIPSPWGWASTFGAILLVGGVQLMVLGVIGEYLGRMFEEIRRRPLYVVRDRIGFDAGAPEGRGRESRR